MDLREASDRFDRGIEVDHASVIRSITGGFDREPRPSEGGDRAVIELGRLGPARPGVEGKTKVRRRRRGPELGDVAAATVVRADEE